MTATTTHIDIEKISIAGGIVVVALVIAVLGIIFLNQLRQNQLKRDRDMAVDGCMQNARYSWQAKNKADPTLTDTTSEPVRFWYKLCMQEKGYDIQISL